MNSEVRKSTIDRKTKETSVSLSLAVDGSGKADISTGIGFFDHMLDLFTHHGLFDLSLAVKGDLEVDYHHTVEDIGICLGQAFREAIGDARGIERYASGYLPMDEALCRIAIDISNRPHLDFNCDLPKTKVGTFDVELTEEFFRAFVNNSRITMHIDILRGTNLHHIIEAVFKGFGFFLKKASLKDPKKPNVPSTKGVL
jgi:imidazoleglycerol-phosphate dehydratase